MKLLKWIYFNSGSENRYLGTGFIITKKLKAAIVEFKPLPDRICYSRLRGKYQKITLINIHAPTEEAYIDIKEKFYSNLDREYKKLAKYDLKVGDANEKI